MGDLTDGDRDPLGEQIDLSSRFLCADGACIGTIGSDGCCKHCQKPIAPDDVEPFEIAFNLRLDDSFERQTPSSSTVQTTDEASSYPYDEEESDSATPPDFDNRLLCPDGACVGVIGGDMRCNQCGLPYEADPS